MTITLYKVDGTQVSYQQVIMYSYDNGLLLFTVPATTGSTSKEIRTNLSFLIE